jgi:hypothetical protein
VSNAITGISAWAQTIRSKKMTRYAAIGVGAVVVLVIGWFGFKWFKTKTS